MRQMIKMIVVLTVLSTFSGGLLAAIQNKLKDRIQYQELKFVKGPALHQIFEGASNDPLIDRFKIKDNDTERNFFVGILGKEASSVAFESFGNGFGGKLGLMVGVDTKTDKIINVRVTTHLETPGVGSKAKDDPTFVSQFSGLKLHQLFKVKADGGKVDAMSGATNTSRGVSSAATSAGEIYNRLKPEIIKSLEQFNK